MKILVVGDIGQLEETRQKLGQHDYRHVTSHEAAANFVRENEVVFDFLIGGKPEAIQIYTPETLAVFVNSWRVPLAVLCRGSRDTMKCSAFGFNGFPTMFNREYLEVSLLKPEEAPALKRICAELKTEYLVVEDRVGFVTPRVIAMIINEAYYTVQEGTASRGDIDLAMKLGTNYPYGPFEWCERIGLRNVYTLLEALHDDTKDERYKISALMKTEYLRLRG